MNERREKERDFIFSKRIIEKVSMYIDFYVKKNKKKEGR
jgi:hypothetical protein